MTNIVMLVRDRYKLTEQAINSLRKHTDPDQYNLTIVDDGSTDFRVTRYLKWLAGPRTSVIRLEQSGHVLSQAKNLGVYWSGQHFGRGDWLYLSDNDVYFTPNWLPQLISVAVDTEDLEYALWGGQIHPFHQHSKLEFKPDTTEMTEHEVLDGPSWLMCWKTWSIVGPLKSDTAPGPCQSEEYPFCNHLRASGKRIGVIHPHVVLHTGLTQTDGKDAPGRKEREKMMEAGVIYE